MTLFGMALFGQTYSALWKEAEKAEENDLPRTQYDVLMKIVNKAQKEGEYGQLMAAELAGSRVMITIAPDSLQPAVERMEQRYRAATDKALVAVYAVVLKKIYAYNSQLERQEELAVTLDSETCEQLAAVKAAAYKPLVTEGRDSKLFDNDMLSVVGYELRNFRPLHDYYQKSGKRVAAMMTALEIARQERVEGDVEYDDAPYIKTLDSLIAIYGDLPEAVELAIERYEYMDEHTDATLDQKWDYTEETIERWNDYGRTNALRNAQIDMTTRKYDSEMDCQVGLPNKTQELRIWSARNIEQLTLHIYRAKVSGNTQLRPNYEEDYKKLKPLLTELTDLQVTHRYSGKKAYELFNDTIEVPALPVGVYLLELRSNPETEGNRQFYYVSDVRVLSIALPDNKIRYAVVDATEGQPVAGASVELRGYVNGRSDQLMSTLTTDAKGEAIYKYGKERPSSIYAFTKTDDACPPTREYESFIYNEYKRRTEHTHLYTDRAIYRPGQTVHVAAINYEVLNGFEQKAIEGNLLTLVLRDANYKTVAEHRVTTDKYGTCAAEFTLPSNGLTGSFHIESTYGRCSFRVEEYKRPTFEVAFDKVTENYKDGDTIEVKATARSYAGVPVQDAKVKYKVVRRRSFWWWSYSNYWNRGYIGNSSNEKTMSEGEAVTGSDGTFTVQMPMVLPKTDYPMFYDFICKAEVTDQGGETHEAQLSLPLGNRKTVLTSDLPEQIRADQMPKVTLHLRNAAGNDIDAQAKYRINNGKWQTVKTNTPIELPKLASGRYTLEAICQKLRVGDDKSGMGDTLKQEFTVFSLDDQRPAAETDDWFYQSDQQFPNDGSPVTIQVGSSARNVHILYNIFSGNRIIESGTMERSNQLVNRKLTYKEEYGDGLTLVFAWMKQGKCYTHTSKITRPMPDKRLKLQWQTFRDRLTPGQQEEWSLTVKAPSPSGLAGDGASPVDAQLMATLYDKSLDQIVGHYWSFFPSYRFYLPTTSWQFGRWGTLRLNGSLYQSRLSAPALRFSSFDESLFPQPWMSHRYIGGRSFKTGALKRMVANGLPVEEVMATPMLMKESADMAEASVDELQGRIAGLDIVGNAGDLGSGSTERLRGASNLEEEIEVPEVQVRENLNETAFFYPQLQADSTGLVTLKFTLPESLTTWRFLGLAHTTDLCYGSIEGEAVAKKDLMMQPNMPRFLREGDEATISARVINTSERDLSGTAYLTLTDPETEKTVYTQKAPFTVKAGETSSVTFKVDANGENGLTGGALLVAKVMATTDEFSDGEQHYLPILPNRERVTVTYPFTQNEPGTTTIDLTKLFKAPLSSPEGDTNVLLGNEAPSGAVVGASGAVVGAKLTIEYTNNPAWLMIQTLPTIGHPNDDCAICQAASLYANIIGKHIVDQVPQAKTVFEQWKQERLRVGDGTSGMTGNETSLQSQLEKNQELKDLVLNETPWVADADNESEQRQRLADFFDENLMQQRLQSALNKLDKLQRGDGSWSWWPDMPGSVYMTISVAEMMVRQNTMLGEQAETKDMLKGAFKFLGNRMVKLVTEMKKQEEKGYKQSFPSFTALQWLYICKLDGRQLPSSVKQANDYLIKLLKKETKRQTIYEKAMSAIILNSPTYIKSLKEYTVYKEEMGRYYDTPRAGYSWRDYRIPTQVAAIEAIQRLTPGDQQTLDEMRRWLLQEKRTQAWDTPLNSVDAVYAFLSERGVVKSEKLITAVPTALKLDGKPIDTPKATAGIGYVKTAQSYAGEKTFTAEKQSEGTSWGAVYAQFMQTTSDIKDQASGVSIKRELLTADGQPLKTAQVGDRVKVRLTIQSERDLDFVQIQDKRAACMEPVNQLSGYNWRGGYYSTPRDNVTNYYFDQLPKGKQVIETEYYIDRAGQYETGTCTVQCAYASEYRGTTHSQTLKVE